MKNFPYSKTEDPKKELKAPLWKTLENMVLQCPTDLTKSGRESSALSSHSSPLTTTPNHHSNISTPTSVSLTTKTREFYAFINLRISQIHHVLIQVVRGLHLLTPCEPFAQRIGSFEANATHHYVARHEVSTGQHHARLLDAFDQT